MRARWSGRRLPTGACRMGRKCPTRRVFQLRADLVLLAMGFHRFACRGAGSNSLPSLSIRVANVQGEHARLCDEQSEDIRLRRHAPPAQSLVGSGQSAKGRQMRPRRSTRSSRGIERSAAVVECSSPTGSQVSRCENSDSFDPSNQQTKQTVISPRMAGLPSWCSNLPGCLDWTRVRFNWVARIRGP